LENGPQMYVVPQYLLGRSRGQGIGRIHWQFCLAERTKSGENEALVDTRQWALRSPGYGPPLPCQPIGGNIVP
jgi:hypothetical protein